MMTASEMCAKVKIMVSCASQALSLTPQASASGSRAELAFSCLSPIWEVSSE